MSGFFILAMAAIVAAVSIVVLPLVMQRRSKGAGNEDLLVLADQLRELDTDLARGVLSEEEHQQARYELHQSALELGVVNRTRRGKNSTHSRSVGIALVIALLVPISAIGLYLATGQPQAMFQNSTPSKEDDPIKETIQSLSARLKNDDKDSESWLLLARSQYAAGMTAEALSSYDKLSTMVPEDADLLIEYANVLGRENGRNLQGRPTQLISQALRIDPDNPNALALAGAAAMQTGARQQAVEYWTRLQTLTPPDSPDRESVEALLAQAKGTGTPAALQSVAAASTASPSLAKNIRGTITIDQAIADQVAPSDTLFIFARVPGGPPMPLAAVRKPAAGWPVSFTLDDSNAMIEGMSLSESDYVDLIARVSRTGNATPQPGDVEGRIERVAMGAQDITLTLDHVVPSP